MAAKNKPGPPRGFQFPVGFEIELFLSAGIFSFCLSFLFSLPFCSLSFVCILFSSCIEFPKIWYTTSSTGKGGRKVYHIYEICPASKQIVVRKTVAEPPQNRHLCSHCYKILLQVAGVGGWRMCGGEGEGKEVVEVLWLWLCRSQAVEDLRLVMVLALWAAHQ